MREMNILCTDSDYTRFLRAKQMDGFQERTWLDWLRFKTLGIHLVDNLDEAINVTTSTMKPLWFQNFALNIFYYHAAHDKTLLRDINDVPLINFHDARDLLPKHLLETPMHDCVPVGPAVIIGRGPSIFKHEHLKLLANTNLPNLTIITTDGMLLECLRAGVTPDKYANFIVTSVDGHRQLIVRWYGDPDYEEHNPKATPEEKQVNQENITLMNKYASRIKVLVASTVANNVIKRCLQAGASVYMLHPLFDSIGDESLTKIMMAASQTDTTPPLITCASGGNAGAFAWIISWNLLRCSPSILIGMDMGYLPETKIEDTSYAAKVLEQGELEVATQMFMEIKNPYDGKLYKTDGVFSHYVKAFKEMLEEEPPPKWVKTYNCTGGGNLHGIEHLQWRDFKEVLEEQRK